MKVSTGEKCLRKFIHSFARFYTLLSGMISGGQANKLKIAAEPRFPLKEATGAEKYISEKKSVGTVLLIP